MIIIPLGHGERGPAALCGPYINRHGLICGATGTGKTYTLATLSESLSRAGVPVFLCDVKGDLAGLALPGRGIPAPVRFVDVYGEQGAPIRATVRAFGPDLLARVLTLTDIQSEIMGALFATYGGRLDSMADLERALAAPTRGFMATKASLQSIRRALITFRAKGADSFFAAPAFDLATLEARQGGAGVVTILAAERLIREPDLYGAFLLWILRALYDRLPELGDVAAPRLALIFDEAHLMFADASGALVRRIEQTVRLIRSKGVGVYFATQSPADIPPTVAAQLSNRVQHAMRAATLADRREIKGAAECLPDSPGIRAAELIATMGTGVALVSTLDSSGRPSPVDVVRIDPPAGRMGTLTAGQRAPFIKGFVPPGAAKAEAPKADGGCATLLGFAIIAAIIGAACLWPIPMAILACVALIFTVAVLAH